MKLFSLFIVLLLWKMAGLRNLGTKAVVVDYYLQMLNKFLGRSTQFAGQFGFLFTIFLGPFLIALIDTILGPTIFRLVFEIFVLFLVVSSLSVCEFQLVRPNALPESIEERLLLQLPSSIWRLNDQWVAPLFWYLVAGVLGLGVYWIIAMLQQNHSSKWQALARTWIEILAWVPSRILAFAYAVAGNFSQGIKVVSEYLAAGVLYNDFILQRTVLASLYSEKEQEVALQCKKLQRDTQVVLLGIYALLAIVSWFL